jgi:hypothetical protein
MGAIKEIEFSTEIMVLGSIREESRKRLIRKQW